MHKYNAYVSLVESNKILDGIRKSANRKKYISTAHAYGLMLMSIAVFTRKVLVVTYFPSKNSSLAQNGWIE